MGCTASDAAETCLLLLCGLPGAGKTSLARSLAQEACQEGIEVRQVCFDELGCQPSGSGGGGGGDKSDAADTFSPETWQLGRRAALAQLETELASSSSSGSNSSSSLGYLQRQDAASSANPSTAAHQQQGASERRQRRRLVIADDNLHYRSMRWQCYGLGRAAGAAVVLLHLQCSEHVAQERNSQRAAGECVPAAVISRMAAQFEAPGSSGAGSTSSDSDSRRRSIAAWERSCLIECSAEQPVDAAAVWRQVWRAWGAPAPPPFDAEAAAAERAAAQAVTAASKVHAVDVATRQVLSQAMQRLADAVPAAKAAAAQHLNAARRQLLQEAATEPTAAAGAAAEEPGMAAERWAAAYQLRCEAILAGLL